MSAQEDRQPSSPITLAELRWDDDEPRGTSTHTTYEAGPSAGGTAETALRRGTSYLRVSSARQAQTDFGSEGQSIPTQRSAVELKAGEKQSEIVREWVEPGRSATSIDRRPVFQEMLRWIKAEGNIEYLFVYNFSRLFRNTIDAAITKRELAKAGCRIVSCTFDMGETKEAELVEHIVNAVDEYHSKALAEDVSFKMGAAAKRGGTVYKAPLGYRNVRAERPGGGTVSAVEVDQERAEFIVQLFELFATGEWNYEMLAAEISARGLRTRPGRYPAKEISAKKIQAILGDPYYVGKIAYEGEIYEGKHEALVSDELFDRVQEILATRSRAGERRRKHHHYLKGSLWCWSCQDRHRMSRLLIAKTKGNGGTYDYFFCVGRQAQNHKVCSEPYLPVSEVEEAIAQHYRTIRFPAELRRFVSQAVGQTLADERQAEALRVKQLKEQLRKLDTEEDNLLDLVADGSVQSAKVKRRLAGISGQRSKLEAELADSAVDLRAGAQRLERLLELLEDPVTLYRQASDQGRRLLNQAIFVRLYVRGEEVVDDELKPAFAGVVRAARAFEQAKAELEAEGSGAGGPGVRDDKIPAAGAGRDLGNRSMTEVLVTTFGGDTGGGSSTGLMVLPHGQEVREVPALHRPDRGRWQPGPGDRCNGKDRGLDLQRCSQDSVQRWMSRSATHGVAEHNRVTAGHRVGGTGRAVLSHPHCLGKPETWQHRPQEVFPHRAVAEPGIEQKEHQVSSVRFEFFALGGRDVPGDDVTQRGQIG